MLVLFIKKVAISVFIFLGDDHDKIDQRPDSATTQGELLRHANAGMAGIKTMNAEVSQEEAKEEGGKPVFSLAASASGEADAAFHTDGSFGGGLRLAVVTKFLSVFWRCATGHAHDRLV